MSKSLLVLFVFIHISCFSQEYLDLKIVNYNNDTIFSRIKIYKDIISRKPVDNIQNYYNYFNTITVFDTEGNKNKIKVNNIKTLYFIDLKGENRIYYNDGKYLKELKFNGVKLKWFRTIRKNVYDGSITYHDELTDINGKTYYLGLIGAKKNMKKATISKPELIPLIESSNMDDSEILEILKKFED